MDEYTAFCFDEACSYIMIKMQDKENKPHFKKSDKEQKSTEVRYRSAKDLYESLGYKNGSFTKNIE